MDSLLDPLLPLFTRERAAGRAVALGILVATQGSTYRKPGALMLIASGGDYAGLLSGGCLEGDLGQHARSVIDTGTPRLLTYDTRGGDDLIWGLGLGCEGAMQILLLRAGPAEDWQPLAHLARCLAQYTPTSVGVVVASERPDVPLGTLAMPHHAYQRPRGEALTAEAARALNQSAAILDEVEKSGRSALLEDSSAGWKLFTFPLGLPPQFLLLGAGPDAWPVADFATRLSWRVTVADHRPAYANAEHFPCADRVVLAQPEEVFEAISPAPFSAAVVMSHHLPSDLKYLRALAATRIPYIGLLGPAARRERLLADLQADAQRIRARLHSPVGLALGGRTPESIALAIVAEVHGFVHQERK